MKKKSILLMFFVLYIIIVKSQTEEKKSGFYDLKLYYVYSTKGMPGKFRKNMNIKIPFGLGLSSTFKIYKRSYSELGLTFQTEGIKEENGTFKTNGLDINFYHKYTYSYVCLPLQFHFNFLTYKYVKLFVSGGVKGTMYISKDYWNPFYDGIEHDELVKEYDLEYYFGLTEYIDITKRFGIFASQNLGRIIKYYPNNNYHSYFYDDGILKTLDFKLGISYKF